ncbi:hypothetical protein ACFXPX_04950 [Kitasatospora sp. NPDC059146]|uniref:hypothetical protein n=1 Tax=unclassified Kitasatospora TaxID=2633591 RepID=UPI0036AA69D4
MSDTVPAPSAPAAIPGDPARLHLTVTSEIGAPVGRGERQERHRLNVRFLAEGEDPHQWSAAHDQVGVVAVHRIRLERGAVDVGVLAAVQQAEVLEAELAEAVLGSAFTRRGGRSRLVPAVREALGKGPRTDLGDLVLLSHVSVNEPWAGTGLDVLLLGELLARIGGPAVVATAPSFMRGGQDCQSLMASLRTAGFVPLAEHTIVADAALVPALSGPAGQDLLRRYAAEAGH